MVKGNWERRAEQAAVRRAVAKEKKLSRALKNPNGESIIAALLKDEDLISNAKSIEAYLDLAPATIVTSAPMPYNKKKLGIDESEDDSAYLVCRQWMRYDSCAVGKKGKACKLGHIGCQVSHLFAKKTTNSEPTEDECPQERGVEPPIPLFSVSKKDFSRIRFVAIDDICIFDSADPFIWRSWSAERQAELSKRAPTSVFGNLERVIEEEGEEEDDDDEEEEEEEVGGGREGEGREGEGEGERRRRGRGYTDGGDNDNDNDYDKDKAGIGQVAKSNKAQGGKKQGNKSIFMQLVQSRSILHVILTFLCNYSCLQFQSTAHELKASCLKDDAWRIRKKEAFALVAADLSKRKKDEKKKKAKQSHNNKNQDKKDAFARGIAR